MFVICSVSFVFLTLNQPELRCIERRTVLRTQHVNELNCVALTYYLEWCSRVMYLWVGLHLSSLTLLICIQSRCSHPWVEDTTMAVLWLNTSAVSLEPAGQGRDPW